MASNPPFLWLLFASLCQAQVHAGPVGGPGHWDSFVAAVGAPAGADQPSQLPPQHLKAFAPSLTLCSLWSGLGQGQCPPALWLCQVWELEGHGRETPAHGCGRAAKSQGLASAGCAPPPGPGARSRLGWLGGQARVGGRSSLHSPVLSWGSLSPHSHFLPLRTAGAQGRADICVPSRLRGVVL